MEGKSVIDGAHNGTKMTIVYICESGKDYL